HAPRGPSAWRERRSRRGVSSAASRPSVMRILTGFGGIARVLPRSLERSAGASAPSGLISRHSSLCWHSTARYQPITGGEYAEPSDRPTKAVLIDACARLSRFCFALAARRAGSAADHLVAIAGDAARAPPDRL